MLDETLFPAQAGVIPADIEKPNSQCSVPRASGGDPASIKCFHIALICSPRKRG